ncbi:apyrase-like [Sabethes cyaneus]|nr:apyrase-like [Sabethes cyaneus]
MATVVGAVLLTFSALSVTALDHMPADGNVKGLFPLTLIHNNDFHARFEETNLKSKACSEKDRKSGSCIAGIARLYHMINKLRADYKSLNPIYLNAGDNYQGTLWYNLLRWNVTAEFIKKLKPTVMTFGNHEFDHGLKGLRPYLDELKKENIPTVIANMKLNGDKELPELPKSIILTVKGQRIGIIGVLYDKTHESAQTGRVTFFSAVQAVKSEATELKKKGVKIIVVLSHCSLDEDKKIAREAGNDIDVIVGAHSHSFLYSKESNKPYDSINDVIEGPYPELVANGVNKKVLIVQAKAYGKYVGRLTVYFDQDGNVKYWEGFPVYISGSVTQDPAILKDMVVWREIVKKTGSTVVGSTEVELEREPCRDRECTLGVVVADAFADHYTNETFRPLAIAQAGMFRNPIAKGDITNGDIIEATPYGSTVDLILLKGQHIWDAAEHSYTWDDENRTNCLQVSGMRIVIDANKDFYKRVVSIEVRDYRKPKSETYQKLDRNAEYYVATPSYLADGKDGFVSMGKSLARWKGALDSDVFKAYVEKVCVIKNLSLGCVKILGTANKSRRK